MGDRVASHWPSGRRGARRRGTLPAVATASLGLGQDLSRLQGPFGHTHFEPLTAPALEQFLPHLPLLLGRQGEASSCRTLHPFPLLWAVRLQSTPAGPRMAACRLSAPPPAFHTFPAPAHPERGPTAGLQWVSDPALSQPQHPPCPLCPSCNEP